MYRDSLKGLNVVARIFFPLLPNSWQNIQVFQFTSVEEKHIKAGGYIIMQHGFGLLAPRWEKDFLLSQQCP